MPKIMGTRQVFLEIFSGGQSNILRNRGWHRLQLKCIKLKVAKPQGGGGGGGGGKTIFRGAGKKYPLQPPKNPARGFHSISVKGTSTTLHNPSLHIRTKGYA